MPGRDPIAVPYEFQQDNSTANLTIRNWIPAS
jgi:hypothetical protein